MPQKITAVIEEWMSWLFSLKNGMFQIMFKRTTSQPPRKDTANTETTRGRLWGFSKTKYPYQLGFYCFTSTLMTVWDSLFATLCLWSRDRASGCEVVIRSHLESSERKSKRLLLSVSYSTNPPSLSLYLSSSTLILTFGFFSDKCPWPDRQPRGVTTPHPACQVGLKDTQTASDLFNPEIPPLAVWHGCESREDIRRICSARTGWSAWLTGLRLLIIERWQSVWNQHEGCLYCATNRKTPFKHK